MNAVARQRTLVVGGGAAGLMASLRAARSPQVHVVLVEKNERLGTKILISGGGKCNLTHAGAIEDIRSRFRTHEARFLKPAFYRFTNEAFLRLLHERGLATYARSDGRVFPEEPANAKQVVEILAGAVKDAGVDIRLRSAVTGLRIETALEQRSVCTGVFIGDDVLPADRVIVAVGGSSYPATGATGDGWRWARDAGHTVVPLRAALAPLYLADARPAWSGVSLRDIVLRARLGKEGKEFVRRRGDLLFTHKGVSGPAALGVSREVAERMAEAASVSVEVDLAPDTSEESVRLNLRLACESHPQQLSAALAAAYLPSRLVDQFVSDAGLPAGRCAGLGVRAINKLSAAIKGWPLGSVRSVPLERGEVVAGGVSLDEIDPQTMESRIVRGLSLCGEVLDIAGPVGGYNLQAAWSTGWVAGEAAAAGS
jgi:hypothetical protein